MNENVSPKRQRLLLMWQDALQDFAQSKQTYDIPPRLARAARFYGFQRAMFLGLKTLKVCLKEEGWIPLTPKQHLEMAAQAGWISLEWEDAWWILLMSWLEIPEVYEEEQALQLEKNILQYDWVLQNLFSVLQQEK